LNSKFKIALAEFPKLGIKNVLQGDLMYTDDTSEETIDGTKYITFQPNTIVYAVQTDSELGKTIKKSKIGIVFHTTYEGKELQSMKAKFGADVSKLNKTSSVWLDDATYKDVSGTATFNAKETESVTAVLSNVGKTFQRINAPMLRSFLKLQDGMTGNLVGASLKTFNNTKVRQGQKVTNPKKHAIDYASHVQKHFDKMIDKVKTPAAKNKYQKQQREYVREFRKHASNLGNVILFQNLMIDAKMQIVRKLNSVKGLTDTFIRTANGYKVTNPEGYVAIDRVKGNAVKLVDRMEFSYNNFTAIKAWDK